MVLLCPSWPLGRIVSAASQPLASRQFSYQRHVFQVFHGRCLSFSSARTSRSIPFATRLRWSRVPRLAFGAFRLTATGLAIVFLGFLVSGWPGLIRSSHQSTDDAREALKAPRDSINTELALDSLPLVMKLRENASFVESRPHLKMSPSQTRHNLTGGVLMGPGRIEVAPYAWRGEDGKSLISILSVGTDLCGHPGIVHGGFLATVFDEGLAHCCFPSLPDKVGMTARLDVNFRRPAMAGTFLLLRATTTKVEGRKAWVEGRIETVPTEGEEPVILADASALYIAPRGAQLSKALIKTS